MEYIAALTYLFPNCLIEGLGRLNHNQRIAVLAAAGLGSAYAIKVAGSILFAKRPCVEGKHVLITGASSGIGSELAKAYAKGKARLYLVARRRPQLEKVKEECLRLGAAEAHIFCADVSDEEACRNFVEDAFEKLGPIDVLICNAGVAERFLIDSARCPSGEDFHRVMDVNFYGAVHPAKKALPYLRRASQLHKGLKGLSSKGPKVEEKSTIAVVSSILGLIPTAFSSTYVASKHAVTGFYRSLRIESCDEYTVSVIHPGYVKSEMTDGMKTVLPFMETERCAEEILRRLGRREKKIIVPRYYSLLEKMDRCMPSLLEKMMRNLSGLKPKPVAKL